MAQFFNRSGVTAKLSPLLNGVLRILLWPDPNRAALKHIQLVHLIGNLWNNLYRGSTSADHSNLFAREIEPFRPACGVKLLTFKQILACKSGQIRRMQPTKSRNNGFSLKPIATLVTQFPVITLPICGFNGGVKGHLIVHAKVCGALFHIVPNFGTRGVPSRPLRIGRKRVGIQM